MESHTMINSNATPANENEQSKQRQQDQTTINFDATPANENDQSNRQQQDQTTINLDATPENENEQSQKQQQSDSPSAENEEQNQQTQQQARPTPADSAFRWRYLLCRFLKGWIVIGFLLLIWALVDFIIAKQNGYYDLNNEISRRYRIEPIIKTCFGLLMILLVVIPFLVYDRRVKKRKREIEDEYRSQWWYWINPTRIDQIRYRNF